MKLSLKVEYACQVMAQLGYTYGLAELPHIEELAKAEGIPANYLVQILNELRTAGLIVSKRGKQGGYALARAPVEICLLDVMLAMEGEALGYNPNSQGQSAARAREVWGHVCQQFEDVLKSFTLESMMQRGSNEMWYI